MENKEDVTRLNDICDWNHPQRVAIEFHDFQDVLYINYAELKSSRDIIHDLLCNITNFEFIGINFDIAKCRVPSLMLGISASGHAFFNIPEDLLIKERLFLSLNVKYFFTTKITADGEIVRSLQLHNEAVHLMKVSRNANVDGLKKNLYAYGIATSGTTGSPKIVRVPCSCIVPNIHDLKSIFELTGNDKIAQLTNFTFDPSIVEIFLAFSTAATLFMVSYKLRNDANRLLQEIHSNGVSILQMTPSVLFYTWLSESLKTTILSNNSKLRVLSLGGESFPRIDTLLEVWHPENNTRIFNIYGITEVSCWASINEIFRCNSSVKLRDIGKELSCTVLCVKNEKGETVKKGKGVLYIGSTSRTCTIDGEDAGNFEKPVFRNTGDIVERNENGEIFYIGRANNIVKRFGTKVNLTELENTVLELNYIKNSYVLWDENVRKLHLCVTISDKTLETSVIRNNIAKHLRKLPATYQPDKIHILDSLEFTSSGKVCMESLKRKYFNNKVTEMPSDMETVKNVFDKVWKENCPSEDGFLKSGGTSVIALQMSNELSDILSLEFPELIGMLLRDCTYQECLSYVIDRTCNSYDSKFANSTVQTTDKIEEFLNENSVGESPSTSGIKQIDAGVYYKCRGNIWGRISRKNENYKVGKKVSDISVLKSFDLKKCVDASPTVFQYGP